MIDALILGIIGMVICWGVATIWFLVCRNEHNYSWHTPEHDKRNRFVVRCWVLGGLACLVWPIALPVAAVWGMYQVFKYAFPRQSEESTLRDGTCNCR